MEYICKFCNKICKNLNSLTQHQIRCKANPDKINTKISNETKEKISSTMKIANTNSSRIWTIEAIEKVRKASIKFNSTYWTTENKEKHSKLMKSIVEKNPESYSTNNISGRAKIYEYNGFKLKGTWEVKVVSILDKLNIKWTNKITPFPYYWNKSWHLYFPDFYLIDYNLYLEVKGYQRDRDIEKWKVLDNLLIIKKKEMKELSIDNNKILTYIESVIKKINKKI